MIEQCMTICQSIETCQCTKRLLMILKIYQCVMYNRKQKMFSGMDAKNELVSMYHAVTTGIGYSSVEMMNDFYHCRFYHSHMPHWFDHCRKVYESNYCVYSFGKNKRHCSIFQRYHRNKYDTKDLKKQRKWFEI